MSKHIALFAHPEFLPEFNEEIEFHVKSKTISNVVKNEANLIVCELKKEFENVCFIWPKQVWTDVQILPIVSIGDAVKKLKSLRHKWNFQSYKLHRRGSLIQESLRTEPRSEKIDFKAEISSDSVWTLLDKDTILCGQHLGPQTQLREYSFNEDKINPPSRAYLKLWELFTRTQHAPKTEESALELGASPGGWTWVLLNAGCKVLAYDRSPLDPRLAKFSGLSFEKKDIFKVHPLELKSQGLHYDWVVSDVIGETEKLCDLAFDWYKSNVSKNLIFTIKFKGKTEMSSVYKLLEKVPGSKAIHLENNKHEITWYFLPSAPLFRP